MTRFQAHAFCHRCGTGYGIDDPTAGWPRRCVNDDCRHVEFANPKPIGVMLQTVTDGERVGILTPIRGHAPMIGHPGGTGGFQELTDQSSEHAGSRETWEEVFKQLGIPMVDEDEIELLCSRSTGPFMPERRQNLVFSVNATPIDVALLDAFVPDAETAAIDVSWEPRVLAFPSHTYALARYFQVYQNMDVPEAYIRQPRTGDEVATAQGLRAVFETPYDQPLLDDGVWQVLLDDGGDPVAVVHSEGRWMAR